mgnify:FL=1
MRVAVYCSSAPEIEQKYLDLAHRVGQEIGLRGHELVWGGGTISMMGAVSRGAREASGKTFGIIPEKLFNIEFVDSSATETIEVANMRERKAMIEAMSDAFIALPGGIGTLEEFFEIWVGRYLGFHDKPIAVIDPFGAYTPLRSALEHLSDLKFMKPGQSDLVFWTSDVTAALDALQS